jgi:hypothetical protein
VSILDKLIIGAFIALLFFGESRRAAFIILVFNIIYYNFIINMDWDSYYVYAASLNTVLGVILYSKYRVVAILSFSLILVNYTGYLLSFYRYETAVYDNICLTIIALQIIMLIFRGPLGGVDISYKFRHVVFLVDFDSNKNHAKIQKTT